MNGIPRLICVNIDVDALRLYRGIHGLPQRDEHAETYQAGVARFIDMLNGLNMPGTVFAVASDLLPPARSVLQDAVSHGHEIASHSMTHPYNLFKIDAPERELQESRAVLEDAVGVRIHGFRSPGYNLSPGLLSAIARSYDYDSSILPSPPYFLARATIIGLMRIVGKRSSSFVGHFSQFAKGWRPFTWAIDGKSLPELPMSAVYGVPVIGTTLAKGGAVINKALSLLKKRDFINIEFHAIDFMDFSDGLERELAVEPALRVPLSLRLERFSKALTQLAHSHDPVTLNTAVSSIWKGG